VNPIAESAAAGTVEPATMNEKTFSEIEAKIRGATAVGEDRKRELLEQLGKLQAEVTALSRTNDEQARSITGFAQVSAHEATRAEQNAQLRELSVQGLRSSVDGFEQSHPKLVQIVNNISNTLANLGI
jgi:Mg2+ and Co2+ transporter CorA